MATNSTSTAFPNSDLSLPVTAGVYHDIQHFLFREALLLDHRRFDEWTGLLSSDVVFRMPARFAREIGMEFPAGVDCFHDDRVAAGLRVRVRAAHGVVGRSGNGRVMSERSILNLGMIASLGSGILADSIAIMTMMPR